MSYTLVEKHPSNKKSAIAIRAYFDPSIANMGLEKYGLSLYDGVMHEESLALLELNGVKRYVTGLNEFAPDIKSLPEEEREARVKQIRAVVSELEKQLASNVLKVEDEDFWNKVQVCRPDNSTFWDKIFLRCGNDPAFLEPEKDPYDLIKLYAIEAGGFSMVAKSLEDARSRANPPKFYLDKQEDTAALVTEVKKLKAKAMGELQRMFDKHQNKLFLIAKVLDPNSMQYKKNTPNDVLYNNLFEYIEGNRTDKDKRKCAQRFLDAAGLDMETLKLRCIVKDATFLKQLYTKADGFIYHLNSSTLMGKNPSECVEFLKNPLHEDILRTVQGEVEKYWNL
jgi:hypothetical protein